MLYTWHTNNLNITAMEVLSDESIVMCSSNGQLTRHNKQNGRVLYQKKLENWAGGLAEIGLGNQQCLALSFEIAEKDKEG